MAKLNPEVKYLQEIVNCYISLTYYILFVIMIRQ